MDMTIEEALVFIIEHTYEDAVIKGLERTYERAMDLLTSRHIHEPTNHDQAVRETR